MRLNIIAIKINFIEYQKENNNNNNKVNKKTRRKIRREAKGNEMNEVKNVFPFFLYFFLSSCEKSFLLRKVIEFSPTFFFN